MNADFPKELGGHIWHTTSRERYVDILKDGLIKAEPNIQDQERWGTAVGEAKYPFARSIGAVSLFDFRCFDPVNYSELYPVSFWRTFVPCVHRWSEAIWIGFAIEAIKNSFVSGDELLARWKSSGELCRNIMPMIEAAFIGDLPVALAFSVLSYKKSLGRFGNVDLPNKSFKRTRASRAT